MIPTIRYSGKQRSIETMQRSEVARGPGRGKGQLEEHRGGLGQRNYFV